MFTKSPHPFTLYVDGSSRGNPGPSAVGIVVYSDIRKEPVHKISKYIGITTNNVAEYEAIISALKWLVQCGIKYAVIKLDSELVYKQITGEYKVRSQHISYQHKRVNQLRNQIEDLSLILIPRSENKQANRLAQKASKRIKISKKTFRQDRLID